MRMGVLKYTYQGREGGNVLNRLKRWLRYFISKDFLMFLITGAFNTLTTSLFSTWLSYVIHDNISATIGYILALALSYFINSPLVFHKSYSMKSFWYYMLSYIPNFLIYTGICFITINWLKLPQFIATALPIMVAGPVTFVILKFFAFGEKGKKG